MSITIKEFNTEADCTVERIRREIQNGPTTRARKAIIRANFLNFLNRSDLESSQLLLNTDNEIRLAAPIRSIRQILDDLAVWEVLDDQISLKNNKKEDIKDEFPDEPNEYWEDAIEYLDEEDSICLIDWDTVCDVEDFDGWEEIRLKTEGVIKVVENEQQSEDVKK